VKTAGILKVKHWETGVAILTREFKVWVVTDLESPFCEQMAPLSKFQHSIMFIVGSNRCSIGL